MERNLVYITGTLKAINAKYEVNNVSVEAEPNFDIAKKWIEKFFSLD